MDITRVVVVLLVVIMTFSLCACKKVEEKIAEKTAEMFLEEALGADVDITKDGGKVKVDGMTVEAGENLPWPKEVMGDLPKPEGKVTMVMEDEEHNSCTVGIAKFEPDDAEKYINMLKEMCIDGGNLYEETGVVAFSGYTVKGALINFQYNYHNKEAYISHYPEGRSNSIYMPNNAGFQSSGYTTSDQAETGELPENYPEDIFPINKDDIITVARKQDFGTVMEYSFIVESQMSTEEIVKYYKSKWSPINVEYETVSSKTFEFAGTKKDYNFAVNGSVSEEDPNKVEYYVYIMEYDK